MAHQEFGIELGTAAQIQDGMRLFDYWSQNSNQKIVKNIL